MCLSRSDRVTAMDDTLPPWNLVREEAIRLSELEPAMQAQLHEEIVSASDPKAIVSSILASRLSSRHVEYDRLKSLFDEVLEGDTSLIHICGDDLNAVLTRDPACRSHLQAVLNFKGFHALETYRIAHRLWNLDRPDVAVWLSNTASRVFGADIHPAARLGRAIVLDHGSDIVIGETCVVGDDVSMFQGVTLGGTGKVQGDRHPKIEQGVTIGAGAKILGNIAVGAFSKVAAGSVVLSPVPPRTTVAGVPAEIVRGTERSDFLGPSVTVSKLKRQVAMALD